MNDQNLIQSLLEPLLDDFEYWFERSRTLLESESMSVLSTEQQSDLLTRLLTAQQEVATTKMLLTITGRQAGVEAAVLTPWHRLVMECWQVAKQHRLGKTSDHPTS